MKYRLPLLLGLLGAFAAYIYFFEIKTTEKQKEEKRQAARVVPVDTNAITSIRFENSYDLFELKNENNIWVLKKPIEDQADTFFVNRMLDFFNKQSFVQEITDVENPFETFQFSTKNIWIEVATANELYKVTISDLVALNGQTYLKIDHKGQTKYVLSSPEWKGEFDRTLLYFRNKFVFRDDMNSLVSIEKLKNGKRIYKVTNKGNENWVWEARDNVSIDKDMVYEVIKDLVQASATDFLDEKNIESSKKKQIGLDKNASAFQLQLKDKTITFSYSQPNAQKTYIFMDGKIYELFQNALPFINWDLDDYKNRKKPFWLSLAEVASIHFKNNGSTIEIQRKKDSWSKGFPGNRFIRILTDQTVVRYLPQTLPNQFDSNLKVVLNSGDVITLSWSEADENKNEILMTSSKINETFLVEAKQWKSLVSIIKGDSEWDSKNSKSE